MTILTGIKSYGTYQRFEYQTVNLEPMKKFGIGLLKLIAVLFVLAALAVIGLMLFQIVATLASIVTTFLVTNAWQLFCVPVVFVGMWKVKP